MKWLWRGLAVLGAVLVLGFLLLRVPDTDRAEMRAKYGAPPSQFAELPGGPTVHYRDEGPRNAPAILLLHGSNADLHTWQPWVDRLKARYRIIRVDQRGHGLTGAAPNGDYRPDAYADDVAALAAHLKLDRFILAGNSMGGGIAARYAMQHPERLAGLVLIDAGGAPVKREGSGNLGFTIARIPVLNRLAFQVMPRSVIEKSFRQSVSNQAVATPETIDRYFELARYPGNRDATLARFSQPMSAFSPEAIRALTVPTLVMWGAEDKLIPLAAGRWFKRMLPNARLVAYPGIGHLPMEETPDRSAADLSTFVDSLAVSAAPRRVAVLFPLPRPGT